MMPFISIPEFNFFKTPYSLFRPTFAFSWTGEEKDVLQWTTHPAKYAYMKKVIISVKDLVKRYGDFEAVRGLSFEVYEGEIFGLLGPNGAGKSTTLEIIETLRDKTSGTVTVDGFDLDENPDEIK